MWSVQTVGRLAHFTCWSPHFLSAAYLVALLWSGASSYLSFVLSHLHILLSMPPKHKGNGKKAKGVIVSVSWTKWSKRAARCNQVPATPVRGPWQNTRRRWPSQLSRSGFWEVGDDDADAGGPLQQGPGHWGQAEGEGCFTYSPDRWRAIHHQPSPALEPDLPEAMRQRVAKKLQQLPIITASTTCEDLSTDEDQLTPPHPMILEIRYVADWRQYGGETYYIATWVHLLFSQQHMRSYHFPCLSKDTSLLWKVRRGLLRKGWHLFREVNGWHWTLWLRVGQSIS